MKESIYFSGFGISHGKYAIENRDIEKEVTNGFIGGFDAERIKRSTDFEKHIEEGGKMTPFDFFAKEKMGFDTRYHVVPFPPTKAKYRHAENALDLGVKAVQAALDDCGIDPEEVAAWLASNATPHEQAPGIAATIKCHFVGFNNQSPTFTTSSACVGFNINIERAMDYFATHPEAKHIVIVHTEVMSRLLTNEPSFVPFVTFADAAAAVVLSKSEVKTGAGITHVVNAEDMQMIDFLGADKYGDLYMDPGKVRERATTNIVNIVQELYAKNNWSNDIVDMVVPHQTGNAIVIAAAKQLQIPPQKLYQEVQYKYGNLSGASIPFSLALLNKENKLNPGTKIITAVCGLGGEYGGFTYEVPERDQTTSPVKPLKGKRALVTGATGGLGSNLCKILAEKGCDVILQYNSNTSKAEELSQEITQHGVKSTLIQADFSKKEASDIVAKSITEPINYIIHTSAITGNLLRASEVEIEEMMDVNHVNYIVPTEITQKLHHKVTETVLFIGSVAEDALFSGSSSYVTSKRSSHAFAVSYAAMALKNKVRTIYYMIGLLDKGMIDKLNPKQRILAMEDIGQSKLLNTNEVAERIVRSLYLPKVIGVEHSREGELVVRRDGFSK
ncbi:MAG: SDR family NAD(P)-dependent oxidoreductase [Salinivirgaceae bacterium]|nr:SDR family NAD(P)-dependent oxidoreductase [Salinivirgaceae bacterium]